MIKDSNFSDQTPSPSNSGSQLSSESMDAVGEMLGKVCIDMTEGIERLEIISQKLSRYGIVTNIHNRSFSAKGTGNCQNTKYSMQTNFEMPKKEPVEQTFNAIDVASRGGR